ncbi:esterase/lipase family protein [Gordonia sp. DT219]|uniref:esterase/lipase family protein n=1 Tax=Gordonia sp. DT219 TaxID=3416658 RepID=UPI003CF068AE
MRGDTSRRGWTRKLVTSLAAAATGIGVAATLAGPAAAADQQQQLADYINAGAKKPVVAENILKGGSTWQTPAGNGPQQDSFLPAFAYGLTNSNAAPPGANDWSCKPAEGQEPVVLVHGTWENAYNNWAMISPALKKEGYCVYALNYGISNPLQGGGLGGLLPGANGTGDIAKSGKQVGQFVDKVLKSTGASKVNMVGHSQGGITAREYLRYDGGAAKVDNLVTLGATNNGTSLDGIGTLGRTINNLGIDTLGPIALAVGTSGIQQVYDSVYIKHLNAGGKYAIGDVNYTIVGSRYDEVTTPYQSTFFPAGTPHTKNITLQNGCEQDTSDHLALSYSPRAVSIVLNAFDHKTKIVCAPNAWLFG